MLRSQHKVERVSRFEIIALIMMAVLIVVTGVASRKRTVIHVNTCPSNEAPAAWLDASYRGGKSFTVRNAAP